MAPSFHCNDEFHSCQRMEAKKESNTDLLDFQRNIARYYLRNFTAKQAPKRSVSSSVAGATGNHFPKRIENPLRCRQCHNRIRWICEQCFESFCVAKEFIQINKLIFLHTHSTSVPSFLNCLYFKFLMLFLVI